MPAFSSLRAKVCFFGAEHHHSGPQPEKSWLLGTPSRDLWRVCSSYSCRQRCWMAILCPRNFGKAPTFSVTLTFCCNPVGTGGFACMPPFCSAELSAAPQPLCRGGATPWCIPSGHPSKLPNSSCDRELFRALILSHLSVPFLGMRRCRTGAAFGAGCRCSCQPWPPVRSLATFPVFLWGR